MNHPIFQKIDQIEQKLDLILAALSKMETKRTDFYIIDNDEFQNLFNISQGTAANWRDQGLIAFSQIKNKIFYKIDDVKKLIKENYHPSKKK